MNKFPKNTTNLPKVSGKSGRTAAKKAAGNATANIRNNEKRGTPNPEKTLAESAWSNEQNEKNYVEGIDVEKMTNSDVVAESSFSDESVITNAMENCEFSEHEKRIVQDIQNESVPVPANLSISHSGEPLKSLQDEYLQEEQPATECTVIDGNILGTLQAYCFAPAKLRVTHGNLHVRGRTEDVETVITEIESEPRLMHPQSQNSISDELEGSSETTGEPLNLSDVELAVALIKGAQSQAAMPEGANQIIDALLTAVVKGSAKLSPSPQKSNVCFSKILTGVVCAISMVAISLILLSEPKHPRFNLEPPPT